MLLYEYYYKEFANKMNSENTYAFQNKTAFIPSKHNNSIQSSSP